MLIPPLPTHEVLPDMPSAINDDHDGRYFTETEIVAGYVPYTGANATVDLGSQSLTTTGTGTFDKVFINAAAVHTLEDDASGLLINSGTGLVQFSSKLFIEGTTDTTVLLDRVNDTTELCEFQYSTANATPDWFHGLADSDSALDGDEFWIGRQSGSVDPDVVIENEGTFLARRYAELYLDGWWQFSGDVAATGIILDSSENNEDGTLVADAAVVNNVLVLDGTGDYAALTNNFNYTTEDFTFSLWIKPTVSAAQNLITNATFNTSGYSFILTASDEVLFQTHGSGARQTTTTSTTVTIGQWSQIVVARTGTTVDIYINGLEASYSANPAHQDMGSAAGVTNLGADLAGSGVFTGSMADVRIYNRYFKQEDVQRIYREDYKGNGYFNSLDVTGNATLDGGVLFFQETTTPTAVTNYGAIYTKTNNELFFQDGAGVEHLLHGDAFSNIWFHSVSVDTVEITTQSLFTLIDSFENIGEQDDLGNVTANTTNNDLTIGTNGAGKYKLTFHASISSQTSASEMVLAMGITLNTPIDVTGATNATPIVVTSVAHGLLNGDMITIVGATTNTAANGDWVVTAKTDDTFTLVDLEGTNSAGNGVYDASSGDVTIKYPGNTVIHREVGFGALGVGGANADTNLAASDKVKLYVANVDSTKDLFVAIVNMEINRIGD